MEAAFLFNPGRRRVGSALATGPRFLPLLEFQAPIFAFRRQHSGGEDRITGPLLLFKIAARPGGHAKDIRILLFETIGYLTFLLLGILVVGWESEDAGRFEKAGGGAADLCPELVVLETQLLADPSQTWVVGYDY